jgi:hypothetical protein
VPEGKYFLRGPPSNWLKADMWSMGAIAAFLWWGKVPGWLLEEAPCSTPLQVVRKVQKLSAEEGLGARKKKRLEQQAWLEKCRREHGDAAAEQLAAREAASWEAECDAAEEAWVPPQGLLDLLSSCLLADPAKRKTAQELLALPWFKRERAEVLGNAQEQSAAAEQPSALSAEPAAAAAVGSAGTCTNTGWGSALDALVQDWCRA